MWVEVKVRRLNGWAAPTRRIVFVLTLKALSMSIGASSPGPPLDCVYVHYTIGASQEDGTVLAGQRARPCCVHATCRKQVAGR